MKRKIATLSIAVVMALGLSISAFANSAGYNADLPISGLHTTICSTTKGDSGASYLNNNCTHIQNQSSGWCWSFWVDANGLGQVCNTTTIGYAQGYKLSYNQNVSKETSVQARGSSNGLFSSSLNVKGTVDFDVR